VTALTGASGAGAALACRLSRPGHRLVGVTEPPPIGEGLSGGG
jgi:hypothetical protein